MIAVEEAFRIIQANLPSFGVTQASLAEPRPARLAEDLFADRDYPPFDRSTMDGIAVSLEALNSGRLEFTVEGICAAGRPQETLPNNTSCLEIMTGAPLPLGADLVIPYEEISIENGVAQILTKTKRERFANVHRASSDYAKDALLLRGSQRLNGPNWGIAASIGRTDVLVQKQPKIQIISTGDELVSVAETPLPHQIRRSNAHALQASLHLFGYTDVTLTHLNDDESKLQTHYLEASDAFDVLIYSGGISKGKFDYLPSVWKRSGVRELFHGVSQRPGKPLWFGLDETRKTVVLGLPGNPVSSLVCLHRYFLEQRPLYARLTCDFKFEKNLTYFLPVTIESKADGALYAHPHKIKNSGEFSALAGTDGFLELPKDQNHFARDTAYRFYSWSPM